MTKAPAPLRDGHLVRVYAPTRLLAKPPSGSTGSPCEGRGFAAKSESTCRWFIGSSGIRDAHHMGRESFTRRDWQADDRRPAEEGSLIMTTPPIAIPRPAWLDKPPEEWPPAARIAMELLAVSAELRLTREAQEVKKTNQANAA